MSPEMVSEKGHDMLSDWWALGIVMFELATGLPPFDDADLERLADKICFEDLPVRSEFSRDFTDLLIRLTHKLMDSRLGCKQGASDIKAHPFFKTIDWSTVRNKGLKPPIVPDPDMKAAVGPDIGPDSKEKCVSLANKNPYKLLASCFDRNVYDKPIDLFQVKRESTDILNFPTNHHSSKDLRRDSGRLSNFTYNKFDRNMNHFNSFLSTGNSQNIG